MNGYSVEEAAEVLGIPQGRVWELIARGVLAGAAEGSSSMRVYLKGTAPAQPMSDADHRERSNGNGHNGDAGSGIELSPFRELLTEFRSLTERYGQALLALGEARGEVASLRSRVDLLEARMDMRLPLRAASTVAWEMPDLQRQPTPPAPAERAAETAPEAQLAPAPEHEATPVPGAAEEMPTAEEPADQQVPPDAIAEAQTVGQPAPEPTPQAPDHRHRGSSSRAAIANLAEALARAEDPALSLLPGAQEAADALAALQRQVEVGAVAPEDAPELAVAEESAAQPPAEPEEPQPADTSFAQGFEEVAAAPAIELAEEFEPSVAPDAGPIMAGENQGAFGSIEQEPPMAEPEPEAAPETATAGTAGELTPDAASPYTTEVIEPDWFADGDFAWLDAPAEEPVDEPMQPTVEGAAEHLEPEDHLQTAEIAEALAEPVPEPEPELAAEVLAADLAPEPPPEPISEEEPISELMAPPSDEGPAERLAYEDEFPRAEEIQDAFTEPAPEPEPITEEAPAAELASEAEPIAAAPAEEAEHLERESEHQVAEEIQDAFTEPAPPEYEPEPAYEAGEPEPEQAPRTEAISIEVDEGQPGAGGSGWRPDDAPRASGTRVTNFGLYRGQPEPTGSSESEARPATAVRDEEALMWFGDEFEAADLEVAAPGWHSEAEQPDVAKTPPPTPLQLSDEEIERLASTEGWDRDEVDAIRGLLGRHGPLHPEPTTETPGSGGEEIPEARADEPSDRATPVPVDLPATSPPPRRPASDGPQPQPDWLRGRRGPAANAYRRLRRLIQG